MAVPQPCNVSNGVMTVRVQDADQLRPSSAPDIDLAENQEVTVRTLSVGTDSITVVAAVGTGRGKLSACGEIEVTAQ